MVLVERQSDGDDRSGSGLALDSGNPSMGIDGPLDHGKPESGSVCFRCEEWIEHPSQVIRIDAAAVVFDLDDSAERSGRQKEFISS